MDKNIFSIPVSQKNQSSMMRRFVVFSSILFLIIFILGSVAFIFLMGQILHKNEGQELIKTVELERLRIVASVNSEIAIIQKMADSPLIQRYFTNPDDPEMENLALEEISAYQRSLGGKSLFWVNDKDKIFHTSDYDPYVVDPSASRNYWYNMTLYELKSQNFNINYNPELNVTNLWINVPVFDVEDASLPIGIVGAGLNLSSFINDIYDSFSDSLARLYFFNSSNEITGAHNIDLVKNKTRINHELSFIGEEIVAASKNLSSEEMVLFRTKKDNAIAVVGAIPVLGWYIAAVHSFSVGELLDTGMTVLFVVMMLIILSVFAVFNVFAARMLEPLFKVVREISQISSDWDLKRSDDAENQDEIETLGEFLNMTIIDPLTAIYNRRFFDGNMKKIIRSFSRTNSKLSLLMIDIDFFKKYNDTYGHDMGDTCLQEVAKIFAATITREEDFVARYGGEEFAVVLPNTDENGANMIAEKLLTNIRNRRILHENNSVAPYVTVSIGGTTGVVKYPQTEVDYIKSADTALYKAKQSGRDKYVFVDFTESGGE